jgi:hydrogenase-4 component F
MLVAAALLVRQSNYKRMLAYSSIEHMGILAVGCGLGQTATFGALLHMLGSSLAKALLFLVSGNVLIEFRSKRIADVSGLVRRLPASGTLLVLGFLALTGAPPFATFVSEIILVRGAVEAGRPGLAIALVAIQIVIFIALSARFIPMAQGDSGTRERRPEPAWSLLPPAGLLALGLVLGIYLAPPLGRLLGISAVTLGGTVP